MYGRIRKVQTMRGAANSCSLLLKLKLGLDLLLKTISSFRITDRNVGSLKNFKPTSDWTFSDRLDLEQNKIGYTSYR